MINLPNIIFRSIEHATYVRQVLCRVVYEGMCQLRRSILRVQQVAEIHTQTVLGARQLVSATGKKRNGKFEKQ